MFSTGVYPELLKTGQVRAVYKKGDKSLIGNYRPITLLPTPSKVFEKVILNRLVTFLEGNSLLSECQNGFREKRNTIRAIYQALEAILCSLNENKETLALCLDLSKAFDSVDHVILCQKLEFYGVRGIPLQIIKSYLENRKQCTVEYDNCGVMLKSNKKEVKKGVPQGSILGPLLYILYTNELPEQIKHRSIMYADDTSIIFSEETVENCKVQIVNTLGILDDWFSNNNLILNVNKTQLIAFSRSERTPFKVNYKDTEITTETSLAFLGVKLDQRLDWKVHTAEVAISLAMYSYALGMLSRSVNTQTVLTAYYAYVHSRITYGIIFWGNTEGVARVFMNQKKCIRKVFHLKPRDSCRNVFIQHKILTVVSLYILESVIFVRKNLDLFDDSIPEHNYSTRNKCNLIPDRARYTYIQRNVKYSIKKIWNKVPVLFRNLPPHILKFRLKNFLLGKAYYELHEFFSDQIVL
nr:unnamed protein product [Callosobruchus analis]